MEAIEGLSQTVPLAMEGSPVQLVERSPRQWHESPHATGAHVWKSTLRPPTTQIHQLANQHKSYKGWDMYLMLLLLLLLVELLLCLEQLQLLQKAACCASRQVDGSNNTHQQRCTLCMSCMPSYVDAVPH